MPKLTFKVEAFIRPHEDASIGTVYACAVIISSENVEYMEKTFYSSSALRRKPEEAVKVAIAQALDSLALQKVGK